MARAVGLSAALLGGVLLGGALLPPARAASPPPLVRGSRPAMGTLVGITVRDELPGPVEEQAIDAAYATIERWEALLSEWRPDSFTSRLNRGEAVVLPADAEAMFRRAEALRIVSGGAFALQWKGGSLRTPEPGGAWRAEGGPVGLGAVLKGFLVDRAMESLAGSPHVLIDAAGDVRARGDLDRKGRGWPVAVEHDGVVVARVWLRDEAVSTSGGDRQPGHIRDPRTGEAVTCSRAATVMAPTGEEADSLATALYASCGEVPLPEGARGLWADTSGRLRRIRGR